MVIDHDHGFLIVVVATETRHSDCSLPVAKRYQNQSDLGFFYSLNAKLSGVRKHVRCRADRPGTHLSDLLAENCMEHPKWLGLR